MVRLARAAMLAVLVLLAAASPAAAVELFNETFRDAQLTNINFASGGTIDTARVKPCLTAGTDTDQAPVPGCPSNQPAIPAGGDPQGAGALRLTSNVGNATGFLLYQDALPATAGIDVTFNFYAYRSVRTGTGFGADGVTFFLTDGTQDLEVPGAFGGSIGYAQRNTPFAQNGVNGGYIGIGLDEWGNYGNNLEGRGQGCSQPDSGFYPDHVTLRGPGSGQQRYCIVRRENVSTRGSLDNPGAQVRTAASTLRTARIIVDPLSQAGAGVQILLGYDGGPLVQVADIPLPAGAPPTFKFGFASGTGGANNIHEIQNTRIDSILPLPRLRIDKSHAGDFVVGGSGQFTLQPAAEAPTPAQPDIGPVQSAVTVTDTLPAGSLNGLPSGAGWDCSASSGRTVSCTRPASPQAPIPAGTTLPPITVPVRFGANESGVFENPAEVDSQDNANTPQQSGDLDPFKVLPRGQDDFATTPIGTPVLIDILANDRGDLDPDTVQIIDPPANGAAAWSRPAREALYTPDPGFSGIDTFRYRVRDRDGQAIEQTVTIRVTPEAIDDYASTPDNTPVRIDVLKNDLGTVQPGTVTVIRNPSNGLVRIDPATGNATYTPNPGFTGRDTFRYSVRDQAGQLTEATVTIDVYAGPDPPRPPDPPIRPQPPGTPNEADLAVTKNVTSRAAVVGDLLRYEITVTNRGPGLSNRVILTDAFDLNVRLVSARPSRGSCAQALPLQCSLGTLERGDTVRIVLQARALAAGEVTNLAAVSGVTPDPDRANNQATADTRVAGPGLAIEKTASRARVRAGTEVAYSLRVRNRGPGTARAVVVCDTLPAGLSLRSSSPQGRLSNGRVCWRLDTLREGRTKLFLVRTRTLASPTTRRIDNVATVEARGVPTQRDRAAVTIVGSGRTGGVTG